MYSIENCIVVWDVETTQLIDKKRVSIEDMEISVACAIIFEITDVKMLHAKKKTFWSDKVLSSNSLEDLCHLLATCKGHVAYNGLNFDLIVMRKHFRTSVEYVQALQRLHDPFQDLKNLGYLSLQSLLTANKLGSKTASGKEAPVMWREQRFEDLERYCMRDVDLLAQLITNSSSIAIPFLDARVPLSISQLLFPLEFQPTVDALAGAGVTRTQEETKETAHDAKNRNRQTDHEATKSQ